MKTDRPRLTSPLAPCLQTPDDEPKRYGISFLICCRLFFALPSYLSWLRHRVCEISEGALRYPGARMEDNGGSFKSCSFAGGAAEDQTCSDTPLNILQFMFHPSCVHCGGVLTR